MTSPLQSEFRRLLGERPGIDASNALALSDQEFDAIASWLRDVGAVTAEAIRRSRAEWERGVNRSLDVLFAPEPSGMQRVLGAALENCRQELERAYCRIDGPFEVQGVGPYGSEAPCDPRDPQSDQLTDLDRPDVCYFRLVLTQEPLALPCEYFHATCDSVFEGVDALPGGTPVPRVGDRLSVLAANRLRILWRALRDYHRCLARQESYVELDHALSAIAEPLEPRVKQVIPALVCSKDAAMANAHVTLAKVHLAVSDKPDWGILHVVDDEAAERWRDLEGLIRLDPEPEVAAAVAALLGEGRDGHPPGDGRPRPSGMVRVELFVSQSKPEARIWIDGVEVAAFTRNMVLLLDKVSRRPEHVWTVEELQETVSNPRELAPKINRAFEDCGIGEPGVVVEIERNPGERDRWEFQWKAQKTGRSADPAIRAFQVYLP